MALSLLSMEACPAAQPGTTYPQVCPPSPMRLSASVISSIFCRGSFCHGLLQHPCSRPHRRSFGDAAATVGWRESNERQAVGAHCRVRFPRAARAAKLEFYFCCGRKTLNQSSNVTIDFIMAAMTCCGQTRYMDGWTINLANTYQMASSLPPAAMHRYWTAPSRAPAKEPRCTWSLTVCCAVCRLRSHTCRSWKACKPRIFGFANAALDHFLKINGYLGIIRGHMGKQCVMPSSHRHAIKLSRACRCLSFVRSGVQIAKCGRVLTVFSTSNDHHQSR